MTRMSNDGVGQVIYVSYPDYEDDSLRAELDAMRPMLETACAENVTPCHIVDLRPAFAGRIAELTDSSGFLPNSLGSEATAQSIWSTMQAQCIAQ